MGAGELELHHLVHVQLDAHGIVVSAIADN
jgi:hypothetical protein